jgi:hypothetical protein
MIYRCLNWYVGTTARKRRIGPGLPPAHQKWCMPVAFAAGSDPGSFTSGGSLPLVYQGDRPRVKRGGPVRDWPRKYRWCTSKELRWCYKFIPGAPQAGAPTVVHEPGPKKYSRCAHFTAGALAGWFASGNLEIFIALSPLLTSPPLKPEPPHFPAHFPPLLPSI